MNSERHARVNELFLRATKLAPGEQETFISAACEGDAELEAQVCELLAHHVPVTIFEKDKGDEERGVRSHITSRRERSHLRAFVTRILSTRRRRFLVIGITGLSLLGLGIWVHDSVERAAREVRTDELRSILETDALALRLWMEDWKREAETWTSNAVVRARAWELLAMYQRGAEPDELWSSPIREAFYVAVDPYLSSPDGSWVVLLGSDGVVVADPEYAGIIGMRLTRSASAALSDTLAQGTTFFPPYIEDGGATRGKVGFGKGRAVAAVLTPLVDDSGRVIAALAFGKWVRGDFVKILGMGRLGETGETYALDESGRMISESRFHDELTRLGLLPDRPAAASSILTVDVRDPGGDLAAGHEPGSQPGARPLTRAAAAAIGSREEGNPDARRGIILEPYRNYLGKLVVGAWMWLPEYRMGVVSEIHADEAYTPLRYVNVTLGVLFGILVLASGIALASSMSAARLGRQFHTTQVGPYRLKKLLGEGGMGRVYLAEHALLRRPTAVKMLARNEVSAEDVARFEREVQTASRLTHPNTIEIYDYGRTRSGVFYYAMEYLPGLTLAELVAIGGALPAGRAVHILEQVCGSLLEAHQEELVHRDIKPPNVMLCRRGSQYDFVKVLDFGLVKRLRTSTVSDLTAPSRFGGTPLYMAPEQFRDFRGVDPRSDIYAVGALAYFLLTGRSLFHATSDVELLYKVMNEQPEAPSASRDLPMEMDRLVMACIAKDPDERPQGMAEVIHRLRSIRQTVPWTDEDARSWWKAKAEFATKALEHRSDAQARQRPGGSFRFERGVDDELEVRS